MLALGFPCPRTVHWSITFCRKDIAKKLRAENGFSLFRKITTVTMNE